MEALLGEKVRALRTARGLTQEQVAEKLAVSRQKYARVENGSNSITLELLKKLATVFDINVSDITCVLDESPAVMYRTNKDSDSNSSEKMFEMLDLFYANKHLYTKLKNRE